MYGNGQGSAVPTAANRPARVSASAHPRSLPRTALRYSSAVVAVAAATGMRWLWSDHFGPAIAFVTYYPAVPLVAIAAGGGPGLLATVLSAAAANVWVHPADAFGDAMAIGLFCVSGLLVSGTAEALRRERRSRVALLKNEVAARTEELERANAGLRREIETRLRTETILRESEARLAVEADALERLNAASSRLWGMQNETEGLAEMLDATIALLGADMGNVQMLDADRGVLTIAAQRGFGQEFLDCFAAVSAADESACARALRWGERIIIDDIETDARYAPLRRVARTAGYRAVQSTPLLGQDGRPLGVLSTHFRQPHRPDEYDLRRLDLYTRLATDFIERCRINQALRQREAWFRKVFENAPTGIAITDWQGQFQQCNPAYCVLLGYTQDELRQTDFAALVHPDDGAANLAEIDRLKNGQRSWFEIENRYVRKGGEPVWVRKYVSLLPDEVGGPAHQLALVTDVSDRRRAEEVLRKSEERLRLAVRAANVAMWDYNLRTNTVVYSPEWKAQLGYADDEIGNAQSEWESRLHPDDRRATLERTQRSIVGPEDAYEAEFRLRHRDGSWRWIFSRAEVIRDAAGTPVRMIGCHVDITERKRAAEALVASERRFRVLCEHAPIGIFLTDREGCTTYTNSRCQQIYGFSFQEALGQGWSEFIHAEDRARVMEYWLQLAPVAGEFAMEYRAIRPDGACRWVHDRAVPLWSDQGELIGYVGTVEDITERKQAEQALREREARLRAILDTAADAIITIDRTGAIVTVNRAAGRMFGYAADEMLGQNVRMLMPAPYREEHDQYIARYLATGAARVIGHGREVVARRKDGTVFPADLAVSAIESSDQFTGIIRDATRRKELERAVVEVASAEQRRIGQDLHDTVGQEMTGLNLMAESLRANPGAGPELVERIARALRHCQRELRIVLQGLLPVSVDSEGLMAALADLAERTQQEAKVVCSFRCPEPVALADNVTATHLYLIAREAVHNAVKHARPRTVHITLEADHHLCLRVHDDGIGIPGQANADRGVGLRIMRNRAAIIGADLTIERAQPTGTVVTCVLPRSTHEQG